MTTLTTPTYRLPNGAVPVLLSADSSDLVNEEARALLSYVNDHPEVTPQAIADMLFRTRLVRRFRALCMVHDSGELVSALQAVITGRDHPLVVRTNTAATARRLGYVFPGQGSQRPGMGRLFYEAVPAFRSEADRCHKAFGEHFDVSPLKFLLDEQLPPDCSAGTVQPALFVQMAGLAAMWRSFGITPEVTVGHSQGEIAAAYVAGSVTLSDAALVVGIRAHAADEFTPGDYAMAVVAADRDDCEDVLARCAGWVQLSVVNSSTMVGISGDRETVQDIVDTFSERGAFARVIRVHYPAHTTLMNELGDDMRAAMRRQLENPKFLNTDIDCIGSTLGGPITNELPVDQYWFLNLRNTVRFDRAIAAATSRGIDTFVELAEHPTLQLAIHENFAAEADERARVAVGTSSRTATDLGEFTRNLALLAVHSLDYSWDSLATLADSPAPLPVNDFPNTVMRKVQLWLPYDSTPAQPAQPADANPITSPAEPAGAADSQTAPQTRLLVEQWVRLSRRSLVPPRAIGIVDHTGTCANLAAAISVAAKDVGASARVVGVGDAGTDLDTQVILLAQSPELDDVSAAAEVADFFGNRVWWPGIGDTIAHCWLVTTVGESVAAGDGPPDPLHAAAAAGFRSVGAEHLGVAFRHLDMPSGSASSAAANAIVAALHTAEEAELALRDGKLYAKRIVDADFTVADTHTQPPEHVLVIGGTGHLGLEFCEHFARHGARRITLVSRSGETAAIADRLHRLRSETITQVVVTSCDIGDDAAVSLLAGQCHDVPADVIIHAAVGYADMELDALTAENVAEALRAKVVGISRVLQTCPRTEDCRVILCSSAAATIGGRGQITYAAANRMLDAMAHRLRREGIDCVSVQWGQWSVHLDLDAPGLAKLAGTGIVPMAPTDALAVGMQRFPGNAIVVAFDLTRARWALEIYGYGPLLSQLTAPVVETRTDAPDENRPHRFMTLLAEAIGLDNAGKIDTTMPMVAIGLDSLQALEFRRRVQAELDIELDVSDLLGGATIADVLVQLSTP